MAVIDSFIKQYSKEFDFYQGLARIVSNIVEDNTLKSGIKAIVGYRAKRPDRLEAKLLQRNKDIRYLKKEDIENDIIDFAGVRVSLYFPSERTIIDEIINENFQIIQKKEFPDKAHKPKYEKRFSGYWATHYRIKLKDDYVDKRYLDNIVEIQVASLLMHSWSEVEHDLVYKPYSGNLSEEEQAILDELNGLVLTGEIALERLRKAISERNKNLDSISGKFDITNYVLTNLDETELKKLKLGNISLFNLLVKSTGEVSIKLLDQFIKDINPDMDETIADQLISMLLTHTSPDVNALKKYFNSLNIRGRKPSTFEAFIRYWVLFEKTYRQLINNGAPVRYVNPDFNKLIQMQIINHQEADELSHIRHIRNNLVHGLEMPSQKLLEEMTVSLVEITKKMLKGVKGPQSKRQLNEEFLAISKNI